MAIQLPGLTGPFRRLAAVAVTAAAAALVLSGCAAGQDAQTTGQRPPIDGASATAGTLAIRTAAVVASQTGDAYAQGGTALLQLVVVNTGPDSVQLAGVTTAAATSSLISNVGVPTDPTTETTSAAPSDSTSDSTSTSGSASPSDSASPSKTGSASGSTSATGSAKSSTSTAPSETASVAKPPVSTPIKVAAGQSVQIGFSSVGANILLQKLTAPLYPAQTVSVTFNFISGSGSGAITRSITIDIPVQLSSNPPSAPVVSDATEPAENNN